MDLTDFTDSNGGEYEPGDRVVDTESDDDPEERGVAVVIRYPKNGGKTIPASDHRPDALGGDTVADVNPDEYKHDLVVEIAFKQYLDKNVPRWEEKLSEAQDADKSFYQLLQDYCSEWSIPLKMYAYPEGRLERDE